MDNFNPVIRTFLSNFYTGYAEEIEMPLQWNEKFSKKYEAMLAKVRSQ